MYVVAGPSGSGKTSAFPGSQFGCDYFNADDHAAQLNGGSYVGIPRSIRAIVGPICEKFIQDHIAAGKDFATETTLRSTIVFDQMKQAHEAGFVVEFVMSVLIAFTSPLTEWRTGQIWAGIAAPRIPSATFVQRASPTFRAPLMNWERQSISSIYTTIPPTKCRRN